MWTTVFGRLVLKVGSQVPALGLLASEWTLLSCSGRPTPHPTTKALNRFHRAGLGDLKLFAGWLSRSLM